MTRAIGLETLCRPQSTANLFNFLLLLPAILPMAIRVFQPLYASLASFLTTDYSRQLAFSQASIFLLPCLLCLPCLSCYPVYPATRPIEPLPLPISF